MFLLPVERGHKAKDVGVEKRFGARCCFDTVLLVGSDATPFYQFLPCGMEFKRKPKLVEKLEASFARCSVSCFCNCSKHEKISVGKCGNLQTRSAGGIWGRVWENAGDLDHERNCWFVSVLRFLHKYIHVLSQQTGDEKSFNFFSSISCFCGTKLWLFSPLSH